MDTITAAQILSGLSVLCAGVVIAMLRALNKKSAEHDAAFARIETLLTGATGDNGVVGEQKLQRERLHTLSNKQQATSGKLDMLTARVARLEERPS